MVSRARPSRAVLSGEEQTRRRKKGERRGDRKDSMSSWDRGCVPEVTCP
jgi:hypothetical protein